MKLKPLIRQIHLILSIAASVPLVILGVTGALLVFPHWLDEVSLRQEFEIESAGKMLSASTIVAAMNRALPKDDPAHRIVFPETDAEVITATTRQGRMIVLHPHSGAVLSLRDSSAFDLHRLIIDLHVNLLAGSTGKWITGLSALVLCCLSATGLYLWWPAGRWNRNYFLVERNKGWRRLNFDLHRNVGLYSSAILFLLGLTGGALAFHTQVEAIVFRLTGSTPMTDEPKQVAVVAGQAVISPDRAVAAALDRIPGSRLSRLYPPTRPAAPYRVFLNPPASFTSRHHESRLVVDSYTAQVLYENSPSTRSRGEVLLMWILPLHFGTFGGQPTQWIYLVVTLTPVLLSVTGLTIWLARKQKQRRAQVMARNATSMPGNALPIKTLARQAPEPTG